MAIAHDLVERQFLVMRERILSLAADFDRIERAEQGISVLKTDPRIDQLRQAVEILLTARADRAERVQMLLSDTTPPPARRKIPASA